MEISRLFICQVVRLSLA